MTILNKYEILVDNEETTKEEATLVTDIGDEESYPSLNQGYRHRTPQVKSPRKSQKIKSTTSNGFWDHNYNLQTESFPKFNQIQQ